MTDVPADLITERAVLGGMLITDAAVADVADLLTAGDFYDSGLGAVFAAIVSLWRTGQSHDQVAVGTVLERSGDLERAGGRGGLIRMVTETPSTTAGPTYARVIIDHHARRRIMGLTGEAAESARNLRDPGAIIDRLTTDLAGIERPTVGPPVGFGDYDEMCDTSEETGPWVIKGLLREAWRMMYVAGEGSGKSTLLHQIAVCASTGLHPFNRDPIPAVPALMVDLENSPSRIKFGRELIDRGLRGRRSEALSIWSQPGGISLRTRTDVARLEAAIVAARPKVVCLGPLYKAGMNHRKAGEGDEQIAVEMQAVLDDLRTRHGFALVLEHHPPHGDTVHRKMRPRGSAAWLGWSEFGHGLEPHRDHPGSLVVDRFRGDREPALWPDRYDRGQQFPWDGYWERLDHATQPTDPGPTDDF